MGFYIACSVVGTDQIRTISAQKAGYRTATRELLGGVETEVNLEMVRD